MGKRSDFARRPRDFYPTPAEAVTSLALILTLLGAVGGQTGDARLFVIARGKRRKGVGNGGALCALCPRRQRRQSGEDNQAKDERGEEDPDHSAHLASTMSTTRAAALTIRSPHGVTITSSGVSARAPARSARAAREAGQTGSGAGSLGLGVSGAHPLTDAISRLAHRSGFGICHPFMCFLVGFGSAFRRPCRSLGLFGAFFHLTATGSGPRQRPDHQGEDGHDRPRPGKLPPHRQPIRLVAVMRP